MQTMLGEINQNQILNGHWMQYSELENSGLKS